MFNKIGNKNKQDTYIASLIKINKVTRHRPKITANLNHMYTNIK